MNNKLHSQKNRSSKIKSLDNVNYERTSAIISQHKEKSTTKPLQIKKLNKSEDEILSLQTIIISSPKPTQPEINNNTSKPEPVFMNNNSKNLDNHIDESKQTNVNNTIVPILSTQSLNIDAIKQTNKIKQAKRSLKIDINNKDEELDLLFNKSFTTNTETKVTFKNENINEHKQRHSKFKQKKSLSIIPKNSSTNLTNFETTTTNKLQKTKSLRRRISIKYNIKQVPIPQLLKETPKYKGTYKRRASMAIFTSFHSSAFKFFTSNNIEKTPLHCKTPKYYNNISPHINCNIINDSISQIEAENLTNAIFSDVISIQNKNEIKLKDYCEIDFNSKIYNKLKALCIDREIQLKQNKMIDIYNKRKQNYQSYLNKIVGIFKENIMYHALIKEIKTEFKETLNEIIRRETATTLSTANTDETNFFFLIIIQFQLLLNAI